MKKIGLVIVLACLFAIDMSSAFNETQQDNFMTGMNSWSITVDKVDVLQNGSISVANSTANSANIKAQNASEMAAKALDKANIANAKADRALSEVAIVRNTTTPAVVSSTTTGVVTTQSEVGNPSNSSLSKTKKVSLTVEGNASLSEIEAFLDFNQFDEATILVKKDMAASKNDASAGSFQNATAVAGQIAKPSPKEALKPSKKEVNAPSSDTSETIFDLDQPWFTSDPLYKEECGKTVREVYYDCPYLAWSEDVLDAIRIEEQTN